MRNSNSVTMRAVLLGMVLAVLVNIGPTYSGYIVGSSWSDFGHLPLVTLLLFIVLMGLSNLLTKAVRREWTLKPSELLVIFGMGWIAALMQGEWLGGYFIGVISAPNYFASPENQWARHILHNIPDWLILSDKGHAAQWFYEGLPPGQRIPWMVWVVPMFWWFSFFGVLIFVCFCLAVVLRKQWVEHERLVFPLAEIPLMLMKRSEGSLLPDFVRTRVFWIGFLLPIAIICWNIGSWFNPLFPNIPLLVGYNTFPRIVIATGYPEIFAKIDAYVVPFAFLTRMDVLFSVWFFHLLSILQAGLFARVGYSIGTADPWCSADAATGWQSFGGFLVLVVWGFWMARRHLRKVLRRAFSGTGDIDDTEELLSYRIAVFGIVLGLFYLIWWLHRAGMDFRVVFVFLGATLVLYIGTAKIIADTGLVYLRGPLTAQAVTWHTLGAATFTPMSASALGASFTFMSDGKEFVMPAMSHIVKLSDAIRKAKRRMVLAIFLAIFVGALAEVSYVLYQGYHMGAYNFFAGYSAGASTFKDTNILIWNQVVERMRNPFGSDWKRLSFLGMGGVFTGALLYLRYRFIWWPLHPIGFTIASVYPVRSAAFGIFIVWGIKLIILRIGGIKLYRRTVPLFIGLLIGYVTSVGLGFVVDVLFFNGQGHLIHGY